MELMDVYRLYVEHAALGLLLRRFRGVTGEERDELVGTISGMVDCMLESSRIVEEEE